MSPIDVHLRLNHFPIVGLIVLFILFTYAYFFKKAEILSACKVGFVMLTLVSIAVFLSGEKAEALIEHQSGFNSEEMAEHEEHAKQAYFGIILMGAVSLLSFAFKKNEKISRRFNAFLVPIGLVVILLMTLTGLHGAKIKHDELNKNNLIPVNTEITEEE